MKRPRCQEKMVGSQQPCKHRAKYEVTSPIGTGKLVCGIHARQWLSTGLRALQTQGK